MKTYVLLTIVEDGHPLLQELKNFKVAFTEIKYANGDLHIYIAEEDEEFAIRLANKVGEKS